MQARQDDCVDSNLSQRAASRANAYVFGRNRIKLL